MNPRAEPEILVWGGGGVVGAPNCDANILVKKNLHSHTHTHTHTHTNIYIHKLIY